MSRFEKSILGVLVACTLFAVAFPLDDATVPVDEEGWEAWIEKRGGARSYEDFARSVEGLREEEQHIRVHVFGGALYDTEGIDALSICDSRFFYGCFHEFTGRAAADKGIDSIHILNQTCINSLDGSEEEACRHGLGHGIAVFFGYGLEDLITSLDTCALLPGNNIYGGGCFGGIFMEYNLRTMLAENGAVRASSDMLEPCKQLPHEYMPACAYWQPQWWRSGPLSHLTMWEVYGRMGRYCKQLENESVAEEEDKRLLRNMCFGGIGGISAPDAEFNVFLIKKICDAAAGTDEERIVCRANAAYRMTEGPSPSNAIEVCEGLAGAGLEYCRAFAKVNFVRAYEVGLELGL